MADNGGNSQTASTSTPMPNEAKASWVFGIVFGIFLVGVFVFAPQSLPEFKQQILAFICASLAGFFAVFFTGALLLNAELPLPGKWIIKGGAGFALFLIVLFWWRSSSAPISVEPTKPSTSTTSGSPTGTTHDPVVVPPLDIPPIVNGGAPIGIKFQNRYTKNNIQCLGETVKVSATEWEERNASGSPESCYVDAVIFKYTERESKDTKYFLLYEEGRNLFARIPNIPVGETGPTDWRQPPSQAWNAGRVLTRVN